MLNISLVLEGTFKRFVCSIPIGLESSLIGANFFCSFLFLASAFKRSDMLSTQCKRAASGEDTGTTSGGGKRMGRTLHTFSFANFDQLEKGKIRAEGKIDFNSEWAKENVNMVLWNMQGQPITHYAANAGNGGKYDLKTKVSNFYYGSKLYSENGEIVYASARDVGNFAAGMVQQSSIVPNYILSVGFGGYNHTKNKITGALMSLEAFVLDGMSGFPNMPRTPLQAPDYGEDRASAMGIRLGRSYYKNHNGNYLSPNVK